MAIMALETITSYELTTSTLIQHWANCYRLY